MRSLRLLFCLALFLLIVIVGVIVGPYSDRADLHRFRHRPNLQNCVERPGPARIVDDILDHAFEPRRIYANFEAP